MPTRRIGSWVSDITQHRNGEGWVCAAVVLDVYSRRVVGWSTAWTWPAGAVTQPCIVVHSDRGIQCTSWRIGNRLREAGLLGSMGEVASAYDNALTVLCRLDAD